MTRIQSTLHLVIGLLILISAAGAAGQVTKSGTTAGQFLKIGVGSRATAMGESFVALANDVTAVYWNPAGLAEISGNEAMFGHTEWLADITYENIAVAIPLGSSGGTAALWANSMNVPEDEVTTVFQPNGTGERFSASMVALGFSYAKRLTDRFSLGVTGKYIREGIWSMSATGVGIDVGTLYHSQYRNLRIGIGVTNFGTKMHLRGRANLIFVDPDPTLDGNNDQIRSELETDTWELPLMLRAGVAFDAIDAENMRLTVVTNSNHPNDNTENLNIGTELALSETIFLRGGYRGIGLDESEGGLTLGAGLLLEAGNVTGFRLDYAYTDWGVLKKVQRVSISAEF